MANVEEVLCGVLDAAGECGPGDLPSGLGRLDERLAAAAGSFAEGVDLLTLDGTGVPCVKKDMKGVKGKGKDGKARTREVTVGVVGTFRMLDKKGRPVRDPGCESHIVFTCDFYHACEHLRTYRTTQIPSACRLTINYFELHPIAGG